MEYIKKFDEFHNIRKNIVNEMELRRNELPQINVGEINMLNEQEEIEKLAKANLENLNKLCEV